MTTNPRFPTNGIPLTKLDERLDELVVALAELPSVAGLATQLRTLDALVTAVTSPDSPDAIECLAMSPVWRSLADVCDEVVRLVEIRRAG